MKSYGTIFVKEMSSNLIDMRVSTNPSPVVTFIIYIFFLFYFQPLAEADLQIFFFFFLNQIPSGQQVI